MGDQVTGKDITLDTEFTKNCDRSTGDRKRKREGRREQRKRKAGHKLSGTSRAQLVVHRLNLLRKTFNFAYFDDKPSYLVYKFTRILIRVGRNCFEI